MKRSIKLISIKGIPINMHWTFLILLAWVIGANAVTGLVFEKIIWSLVFIALVFLSVTIHEMAHMLVAKSFNIETDEMTLLPVGGISYYGRLPKNTKEEILISMAGPAANLVIAGVLLPFIQEHEPIWNVVHHFDVIHENNFLYKLHLVNLGLFAVNFIPSFPLDGGRVLRSLLGLRMNYFRATTLVVFTGKVLAITFLITGIFYANLLLLVITLLIYGAVQTEEYMLYLRSLVQGLTFGEVMVNDYHSLEAHISVQQAMAVLMTNHSKHFLIMESGKPIGTIHRMHIINEVAEKNYNLVVKELMKENLIYFNAEDDVQVGFKEMIANPQHNFPVMKDNIFVGVVSLLCILEYMLLHQLKPVEHERMKALIKKI
ncbi:MAG TPA: site-2 protease family protein [Chitinophagaceae bacterium]|nr:site-2 protease family protein [Chitinophagaceae bacterium]